MRETVLKSHDNAHHQYTLVMSFTYKNTNNKICGSKMVLVCTTLLWYTLIHLGRYLVMASNTIDSPWEKNAMCQSQDEQYKTAGLIFVTLLILCHGAGHDLFAKAGKIITHLASLY